MFDGARTAIECKRRIIRTKSELEEPCPVCLVSMRGRCVVHVRECGHAMHLSCERQLRQSKGAWRSRCPVCRQPFCDESSLCTNAPDTFSPLDNELLQLLLELLMSGEES